MSNPGSRSNDDKLLAKIKDLEAEVEDLKRHTHPDRDRGKPAPGAGPWVAGVPYWVGHPTGAILDGTATDGSEAMVVTGDPDTDPHAIVDLATWDDPVARVDVWADNAAGEFAYVELNASMSGPTGFAEVSLSVEGGHKLGLEVTAAGGPKFDLGSDTPVVSDLATLLSALDTLGLINYTP